MKKDDMKLWLFGVQAFLLLILVFQISALNNKIAGVDVAAVPSAPAAAAPAAAPTPSAPTPTLDMANLVDDDAIKGDPEAPITIVEWSDYECPFCARFYSQTLAQLDENYIKTGKVKLVFRDFPLSFHPNAQKAAEAAECAGDQDKYYDMHDKLFESGVTGGTTAFKQYAADIGLDTAEFDACLDSGEKASEVSKDMQDGQAAGVRGTPGFIINGQLVSGAQPYENFASIIDAALANS